MALIECEECKNQISEHARWCPQCGFSRSASEPMRTTTHIQDIEMGFGSMIRFMVQLAFASIPAVIIVMIVLGIIGAVVGVGMFGRH